MITCSRKDGLQNPHVILIVGILNDNIRENVDLRQSPHSVLYFQWVCCHHFRHLSLNESACRWRLKHENDLTREFPEASTRARRTEGLW